MSFFRDFVHNVIVHPMMMVLPRDLAHRLHDANGDWAFGKERFDEMKLEGGMHPQEVLYQAECAESTHLWLDDMGVPRKGRDEQELSLVGRIMVYKARSEDEERNNG